MKVEVAATERTLLGFFLAKVHKIDPDILVVSRCLIMSWGSVFIPLFFTVCISWSFTFYWLFTFEYQSMFSELNDPMYW